MKKNYEAARTVKQAAPALALVVAAQGVEISRLKDQNVRITGAVDKLTTVAERNLAAMETMQRLANDRQETLLNEIAVLKATVRTQATQIDHLNRYGCIPI